MRRLLGFLQPNGFLAIMQEVGVIECDVLVSRGSELPAVRDNLNRLIIRLKEIDAGNGEGIINPERWKQFFGEK